MPEEYRVQWTGSREGWPRFFIDMFGGLVLNHVRMRRHAGEDVEPMFAHGGAKGVDETIGAFSAGYAIDQKVWLPDWKAEPRRGGILRNEKMTDEFKPHLGIGLNWNDSPGTRHCVSYMRKQGIPVLSIEYTGDPEGAMFPR